MEIVKEGNHVYECPRCGCQFKINKYDLRFHLNQHWMFITNIYDREDYVNCPQCGDEVIIDQYDCNCVGKRI